MTIKDLQLTTLTKYFGIICTLTIDYNKHFNAMKQNIKDAITKIMNTSLWTNYIRFFIYVLDKDYIF